MNKNSLKFLYVAFVFILSCLRASDNNPTLQRPDLEQGQATSYGSVQFQRLTEKDKAEILVLLSSDEKSHLIDYIKTRWFFEKTAYISEAIGNGLLYTGGCLSSLGTMFSTYPSGEYLSWIGTGCFVSHIMLIGIAKCSARKVTERQNKMDAIAQAAGAKVIDLTPAIHDEANTLAQANASSSSAAPSATTPASSVTTNS